MSLRVMKKLQKDLNDLPEPNAEDDEEMSDPDDDDLSRGREKNLNPFDLLNQQSFSESEFKEDDNETEHTSAAANVCGHVSAAKKKKKKRKKKAKHAGNHISSEDNEITDKLIAMDSLIEKVCAVTSAVNLGPATATKPLHQQMDKSLLSVELKHVNPQNEMRRTFGKRVVKIENKRGRQKLLLKATHIVTPKEFWPPITKNIINMKSLPAPEIYAGSSQNNSTPKTHWFAFEHSQYYQNIQNQFLTALERTDSNFLISLIKRCPYHVDSLIQLSELCKMTEDYTLATELIERAVLILESSLHPSFSLTSGHCRLDYRRQENRAFFIVLFKHAQYLEARACCRTAFELSKLILSLNPEVDPLAIILIIDYYAMRSKEYQWMVKFYEEYDSVRNLSQLPNMAYSYALALFQLKGECSAADRALSYALLMFPGVLRPLLDEMSVQTDKRVLDCSYFNPACSANQPPALHQLACLYVCRAKVIWRQNDVLPWLERNVNAAIDFINTKDELLSDYRLKRANRYVTPPRPILRHVFLSDYKEKVPLAVFLSKDREGVVMYDPLPPQDSVNFYERKSSSSSPTVDNNPGSGLMFFQSMLPTFNFNPQAAVPVEGGGEEDDQPFAGGAPRRAAREARQNHVEGVNRNLGAAAIAVAAAAAPPPAADAPEAGPAAPAEGDSPYHDVSVSITIIADRVRDFLHSFRAVTSAQTLIEENQDSEEDSSDYFD